MDPINILVAVNLIASAAANFSAAKGGVKGAITKTENRPKTWLQSVPPNVSALILVLQILGVFGIGAIAIANIEEHIAIRTVGLILFLIFSWIQVRAYKSLGENYSQDIVVKNNHKLIRTGLYKFIRHPQYVSQVLSDLGAGLALLSYLVVPLVILAEIPLFYMRAKREEKLLQNYFKDDYEEYKQKSGFFLPFIG
ncbi:MAG: isoprenylcysteine carboxylmethyltransferase family protein [Melioribacteraceae bacterium]|nr:isoprenylcysteine carboxylmethyltransferase family protein [Melioribacteraceae bacterium]